MKRCVGPISIWSRENPLTGTLPDYLGCRRVWNMRFHLHILAIVALVVLCGCAPRQSASGPGEPTGEGTAEVAFSPEQTAFIEEVRARGGLKVAVHEIPSAYDRDSSGRPEGFAHSLSVDFAAYLGVPVEFGETSFEDVFGTGGVLPPGYDSNPDVVYQPDVFASYDMVASNLSILPWRLKLMDMVPFVPNTIVLVVPRGSDVTTIKDLNGLSVGVPSGTAYQAAMNSIMMTDDVRPEVVAIPFDVDLLGEVSAGHVDAVLIDSLQLFSSLSKYPELVPAFPVSDLHYLAWGVKKGNDVLESLLLDFFDQSRVSGKMAEDFNKSMGFTLGEYYGLIGFSEAKEIYRYNLTLEERRYIDDLRKRGSMRFATIESPETYEPQENGTIKGLDYHLAALFCHILGVDFDLTVVENPIELFSKDGKFDPAVASDPDIAYDPDIFETNDVIAAPLSIVPWREKLMSFVPTVPVGQVIAGKRAEDITTYADMDGMSVAVLEGSYQQTLLLDLMKREGFTVRFVFMNTDDDPLEYVREGKADLSIDGGIYLARGIEGGLEGITVSPLKPDLVTIGWAVRKDNRLLRSILGKFVDTALNDGTFARIWEENMGVNFEFYLDLISE